MTTSTNDLYKSEIEKRCDELKMIILKDGDDAKRLQFTDTIFNNLVVGVRENTFLEMVVEAKQHEHKQLEHYKRIIEQKNAKNEEVILDVHDPNYAQSLSLMLHEKERKQLLHAQKIEKVRMNHLMDLGKKAYQRDVRDRIVARRQFFEDERKRHDHLIALNEEVADLRMDMHRGLTPSSVKPPRVPQKRLLMTVDVLLGSTKPKEIHVYEGDDIPTLAANFVATHALPDEAMPAIISHIEHTLSQQQK